MSSVIGQKQIKLPARKYESKSIRNNQYNVRTFMDMRSKSQVTNVPIDFATRDKVLAYAIPEPSLELS